MGTDANATPHAQADDHVTNLGHVVAPKSEIPHNIRDAIIGGTLVSHGVGENVHSDPLLGRGAPLRGTRACEFLGELIDGRLAAHLMCLAVRLGGIIVGKLDGTVTHSGPENCRDRLRGRGALGPDWKPRGVGGNLLGGSRAAHALKIGLDNINKKLDVAAVGSRVTGMLTLARGHVGEKLVSHGAALLRVDTGRNEGGGDIASVVDGVQDVVTGSVGHGTCFLSFGLSLDCRVRRGVFSSLSCPAFDCLNYSRLGLVCEPPSQSLHTLVNLACGYPSAPARLSLLGVLPLGGLEYRKLNLTVTKGCVPLCVVVLAG